MSFIDVHAKMYLRNLEIWSPTNTLIVDSAKPQNTPAMPRRCASKLNFISFMGSGGGRPTGATFLFFFLCKHWFCSRDNNKNTTETWFRFADHYSQLRTFLSRFL